MQKRNEMQLLPLYHLFVQATQRGKRITPSGKRISKGTLRQLKIVEKLLLEFQQDSGEHIRIKPLNRNSQREIRQQKKYWETFFRKFCHFLYHKKNHFDNYAGTVIKTIKTFLNYIHLEKAISISQFHKRFHIPCDKWQPIVLTPGQLQFLICNKDFRSKLPLHLQRTLDIFVFGCTVGLRWSDLKSLKKKNISITPDGTYLNVNTQKTGAMVSIPLPEYAIDIINKYKRKAGINILPRLSNSNLNKQIKQVIEIAGWSYSLPKFRNQRGRPVEIKTKMDNSFRFCDHITAHTMRRTAITTLLILGVPEMVVRKISGHAPGSQEFYRYVSVAQDYLDQEVKRAYSVLSPDYKKQS